MLDHLIFNKLKWFNVADNADNVIANGKRYMKLPLQVKADDSYPTLVTVPESGSSVSASPNSVFDVCGDLGQYWAIKANQGHYAIEKAHSTPIWGGKALSIRLYQSFKSLFLTKEVA